MIKNETRASHAVQHLSVRGHFLNKFSEKMGHNSKNIAFKVMPLVLRLLIPLILLVLWATLKFLHIDDNEGDNDDNIAHLINLLMTITTTIIIIIITVVLVFIHHHNLEGFFDRYPAGGESH